MTAAVTWPFHPFGVGDGFYLDKRFNITCNETTSPPTTYLRTSNIKVTSISLSNGELRVLQSIAKECYHQNGTLDPYESGEPRFSLSSFTISSTKNKFTAIGCDAYAIIQGFRGNQRYTTGCMSLCDQAKDIKYESCSGVGCCQITSIPQGLKRFTLRLASYYNDTNVSDFNQCSYAVLAEESKFKFSNTSFEEFWDNRHFSMVLDWSIGDGQLMILPVKRLESMRILLAIWKLVSL